MIEPTDDTVQKLIRGTVAAGSVNAPVADLYRFFHEEWLNFVADGAEPAEPTDIWDFFDKRVIDGHDNFPSPNGLYVSVTRMRPAVPQGPGQRLYIETDDDGDCRLNAETSREVAGEWSIQWHGYVDKGGKHAGPSPFDYANQFWFWCHSADGVALMQLHGLNFVACTDPRDYSFVVSDNTFERRAGCDFKVSYLQKHTVEVPTIGSIPFGGESDLLPNVSLFLGSDGSVDIE